MRSSTIVGVVLLVMAAGLAATQFILPHSGDVALDQALSPAPVMSRAHPLGPDVENDWQTLSPHHVAFPKNRPHRKHHVAVKPKPKHIAVAAEPTPLPAPTFLASTPEPTPDVVIIHHAEAPTVVVDTPSPPRPKKVKPKPRPTVPPGPTAADLARQQAIARTALVDEAKRTASATVASTIQGAVIESVEADDHTATIGVVVVEGRRGATAVENFVFRPGPSGGLVLVERRTVSLSQADPFVGSGAK